MGIGSKLLLLIITIFWDKIVNIYKKARGGGWSGETAHPSEPGWQLPRFPFVESILRKFVNWFDFLIEKWKSKPYGD